MRSLSTRTTGLLILALGAWGGLVPFIGHYFHFALGPDKSWDWTTGRLYLSVLPAAAAVLGGLMLIGAGWRPSARLGALLAIAAGIWFAVGPDVSHLWNAAGAQGAAHGSKLVRVLEMVAYHTGLGALLAALGGYALPRFLVAPEVVAERAAADRPGRVGERRAVGGAALAGGGVAAERERVEDREPVAEREPIAEREPVAEREPIAEREPVAEREPIAEREPVAQHEPVAAREPIAEREPVAAREPIAEHEPIAEREPLADREPATTAMAPADRGETAGAPPAQTVRRRRGGLLSGLLSKR